jgi:hypothetical protein
MHISLQAICDRSVGIKPIMTAVKMITWTRKAAIGSKLFYGIHGDSRWQPLTIIT